MLLLCIASGYYLLLWTNSLYDVLAVLPFKCFVNKQLLLLHASQWNNFNYAQLYLYNGIKRNGQIALNWIL